MTAAAAAATTAVATLAANAAKNFNPRHLLHVATLGSSWPYGSLDPSVDFVLRAARYDIARSFVSKIKCRNVFTSHRTQGFQQPFACLMHTPPIPGSRKSAVLCVQYKSPHMDGYHPLQLKAYPTCK